MTKCKQLGASFWLWLAVAMCLLAHPVWGEDSPGIGWQQCAVERARSPFPAPMDAGRRYDAKSPRRLF